VQQHTEDVAEFEKSKAAHEAVASRLAELEIAHQEFQEAGAAESEHHTTQFEATNA